MQRRMEGRVGRARDNGEQQGDGIVTLLKVASDDLGRLISDHLRLTRLELLADIKAYSSRVAILAALVPIVFLGYAFVCLGTCVVLSKWLGLGVALFLVGGVHLVGAVAASFVAARRLQNMHPMSESVCEASESVSSLAARISSGPEPTVASPGYTPSSAPAIMAKAEREPPIVTSQR